MKATQEKKDKVATEEQLLNPKGVKSISDVLPKGVKSISDVLPKEEFYPDLPRAAWSDLVDCMIIIGDAKIIQLDGDFGKHESALIKYVLRDDIKVGYTTITSGSVIVDKMKKLLDIEKATPGKGFPVAAIVTRVNSPTKGRSAYYDLI